MDFDSELDAARRSYELRVRRLERANDKFSAATAELNHLFGMTFRYPDAARAKFSELLKKRGLRYAVKKMHSDPTDIVPKWKALRGDYGIINGANREKELATANLQKITAKYQRVDEARVEQALANQLLQSAKANMQRLQSSMPIIEHQSEPKRQKRRLRQRR